MKYKTYLTCLSLVSVAYASGAEAIHRMGLKEPTPEELAAYRSAATRITAIRMNPLARTRVAAARTAGKGVAVMAVAESVPFGEEIVGVVGEGGSNRTVSISEPGAAEPSTRVRLLGFGPLPIAVDNSTLPSFPPIGDQGGLGSCAAFSTTYYQLTHMTGLARNWTASGGDLTKIFSPRWTYNLCNAGTDGGMSIYGAHDLFMKNGACRWSEFPYNGSDFREWPRDANVWRGAIQYRIAAMGAIGGLDKPEGLGTLKQLLVNGYVLSFGTFVSSWKTSRTLNNTNSTEDDSYVGQNICRYANGQVGSHAMTIVGYNDAIWCDINANGIQEPEELGALKIANSWGTGSWNSGFIWISYDALKGVSVVPGNGASWPLAPRKAAFTAANWIVARPAYRPEAVAVFTVRHALRNQMSLSLGLGDLSTSVPLAPWSSVALNYGGGGYAFDGSGTACDGSFALDFTELAPPAGIVQRFFLGMNDTTAAGAGTIKSFTVTDAGGTPLGSWAGTNLTVDGTQAWVYATLTWTNSATPEINVSIIDNTTSEESADQARLRVSREAMTTGDLAVTFALSGTATVGEDYVVNAAGTPVLGSVTITNGVSFVDLDIVALDDGEREDRETIVFSVMNGTGYAVGASATATVFIANADLLQLELDVTSPGFSEIYVPEGGSRSFWVRLNGVPTSPVVALVTKVSGDDDLTITGTPPITLSFNASNWHEWQCVTIAAAQDADTSMGGAVFRVTADGMASRDVQAWELDDDAQNLVSDRNCVEVPEGGTASFTLVMNRAPSKDTTVTVRRLSGDADLTVASGTSFVFTASDWFQPRTVVLAAAEDLDGYEGTATIQVSGDLNLRVTMREVENDSSSIGIIPGTVQTVTVLEGGTNSYTVRLSGPPGGSVTVQSALFAGDSDFAVVYGGTLAFDDTNWNTPQFVNVCKTRDGDAVVDVATIRSVIAGVADAKVAFQEYETDTTLNISATIGGTVTPGGAVIVTKGAGTNILATALDGCSFANWSVTNGSATFANSNAANTSVTIFAPATIRANFVITDPDGDTDGDGMCNHNEIIAGTNPTNRFSVLNLTDSSFRPASSKFVIHWQSASGHWYTVYATTNLMTSFGPVDGASNIPATYPVNVYTDDTATVGQKFYRIRVME